MCKRIYRRWTLSALLLAIGFTLQSQDELTLSLFNESTSIPFTRFMTTPLHPGIQVGYEKGWKDNGRLMACPAINLGYLLHRNLFQGVYVSVDLGIDYKTRMGLRFKSKVGIGYLHTFTTQSEYQYSEGQFIRGKDYGNARLMPSLSLGLGYALQPANPSSTEIFVLYQSWLEYPYSPGFIPLMIHNSLHLGAKIYPFDHKIIK